MSKSHKTQLIYQSVQWIICPHYKQRLPHINPDLSGRSIVIFAGPPVSVGQDKCMSLEHSHRLCGAMTSHSHRICEDFNNEPLTPNHKDRRGVKIVLTYANLSRGRATIKVEGPWSAIGQFTLPLTQRAHRRTSNMVRYFSVDWLAQSHHSTSQAEEQEAASPPSCRPHVPCMVQPRPPVYGEGYLQPKPKAFRPVDHIESQRPATCASPGE